ncbi:sensor domain-containing diguanylate cyclase [Thiohalophilus sp.]|uniref:GGDEF domain-containing protein n=1 Tax=Thiohalophilus sp. TaxID=3028392 RepID=UPI002ACDAC0F|nr:sensor domain-containing diguanylate cyclase [Thiohalophilus sp.]MDZ7802529.1 sensor domain-containing diguanylate cyclase [Thiohalophilus sp.]
MDNKPFVEAFQDVNTRLIDLVGTLSVLRELSGFEVTDHDEQRLLQGALQVVAENLELDSVGIFLQDEAERFDLVASRGCDAAEKEDVEAAQAWMKQQARRTTEQFAQGISGALIDNDEVSYIGLPIQASRQLLGVFVACHPHSGFFTVEHERSLIIFCNFLGQLLIKNRLLHDMEKMVTERTQQLQAALEEAEHLKERYATLSVIDELTELHNRRFFFPEAQSVLARAIRYDEPFCLLVLDADNFKSINDRFGHGVGDNVLRAIADLLREEAREADIIARLGGEEFVLALPETAEEGAMTLAERIRLRIANLEFRFAEKDFGITISVGVAALQATHSRETRRALEELLHQADSAMYYSKGHGRNQVNRYSDIACKI